MQRTISAAAAAAPRRLRGVGLVSGLNDDPDRRARARVPRRRRPRGRVRPRRGTRPSRRPTPRTPRSGARDRRPSGGSRGRAPAAWMPRRDRAQHDRPHRHGRDEVTVADSRSGTPGTRRRGARRSARRAGGNPPRRARARSRRRRVSSPPTPRRDPSGDGQPGDEEAARAMEVRQRLQELGPRAVAELRPLVAQRRVDVDRPVRRRTASTTASFSAALIVQTSSTRPCRPGARARARRGGARAGARAAAPRASGDRDARRAPRAPSTARRRARGRSRRARAEARGRRRGRRERRVAPSRRTVFSSRSARASSTSTATTSPASIVALPPGAAQRSSVRSPRRDPTAMARRAATRGSAARSDPRRAPPRRPGRRPTRRGSSGSGRPSISPRTSRTAVSGSSFCATISARASSGAELAPPRLGDPVGIRVAERRLVRGVPSGSDSQSALAPSASRRRTAFVKATARSSRARRTSSTDSFTAA